MAYSLVVDTSNFKPFDYNLMLAALKNYNDNYEKQQAVYDKISLTMGDLASAVEGSDRAKKIYDDYLTRFNAAADAFSRGMNPDTARELTALRNLYGTLIRLLERANEARAKAAEYLRTLNKDNTYLHEDLGTLDDWIDNPNRDIKGFSGNQLSAEVAAMMEATAKSMVHPENYDNLDDYNKIWIATGGFTPDRIGEAQLQLLSGGIGAVTDRNIRNILESVFKSSGLNGWADHSTLLRANEFLAKGLLGGLIENKYGIYDNYGSREALKHKYHELLADQAFNRAALLSLIKDYFNALNNDSSLGYTGVYSLPYLDSSSTDGKLKLSDIQSNITSIIENINGVPVLLGQYIPKGNVEIGPLLLYDNLLKEYRDAMLNYKTIGGHSIPITNPYYIFNGAFGLIPDDFKDNFKTRHGVESLLSSDQYKALRALGYNDNTLMSHDYSLSDYSQRLDNLLTRNQLSVLSGDLVVKAFEDRLIPNLQTTHNSVLQRLDNLGTSTNEYVASDYLTHSDNEDTKDPNYIQQIGLDLQKGLLILKTNKGEYLGINSENIGGLLGTEVKNVFNSSLSEAKLYIEDNPSLTDEQKASAMLNLQISTLSNIATLVSNNYHKVSSQTTSKE